MGKAVADVMQKILSSANLVHGDVKQWWDSIRNVRYAIDMFN